MEKEKKRHRFHREKHDLNLESWMEFGRINSSESLFFDSTNTYETSFEVLNAAVGTQDVKKKTHKIFPKLEGFII